MKGNILILMTNGKLDNFSTEGFDATGAKMITTVKWKMTRAAKSKYMDCKKCVQDFSETLNEKKIRKQSGGMRGEYLLLCIRSILSFLTY